MFGLIGKMRATPGKRDELIAILLDGTGSMPGCLNYIVASDPADADGIWITEVWTDEVSHKASLSFRRSRQRLPGHGRSSRALTARPARRRSAASDSS